jgi:hypothetical protein
LKSLLAYGEYKLDYTIEELKPRLSGEKWGRCPKMTDIKIMH